MREEGDIYVLQANGTWRQITTLGQLEEIAKEMDDDIKVRWFQRPGVGG